MAGHRDRWSEAVSALNRHPRVLQVIFYESSISAGAELAEKAIGAERPVKSAPLW